MLDLLQLVLTSGLPLLQFPLELRRFQLLQEKLSQPNPLRLTLGTALCSWNSFQIHLRNVD